MLTLWDLIEPQPAQAPSKATPKPLCPAKTSRARPPGPAPLHTFPKPGPYDAIVNVMLARYGVEVRKWRRSSSGLASLVQRRDGRIERWLESPRPVTPLSLSIFLHEIGHHALGIGAIKPRCLEEYHAWQFAFAAMREFSVPISETVLSRYRRAMQYAVGKAARRNIRTLPSELLDFAREASVTVNPPGHPRERL